MDNQEIVTHLLHRNVRSDSNFYKLSTPVFGHHPSISHHFQTFQPPAAPRPPGFGKAKKIAALRRRPG